MLGKLDHGLKNGREHIHRGLEQIDQKADSVKGTLDGVVEGAKLRFLNMPITRRGEKIIKDRLTLLSSFSLAIAIFLLLVMTDRPAFFFTGIIVGLIAAVIDFAVEYKGIHFMDWDYASRNLTFRSVPVQLPVLFFSTGVAVTFVVDSFTGPLTNEPFNNLSGLPLSPVQVLLFALGAVYLYRYFTHAVDSMTFGALPVAIALYLWYPKPWMIVLSIAPIYVDYHLEKRLVNSADITYDNYSFEKAFNVAVSYFPSALMMFSLAIILYHILAGLL